MPQPKLEFWYEFASTYSYLSAMRIEALAANMGVEVAWRPFLLGPIFYSQGLETSPFVINQAKGRFMRRDLERLAAERGLAFTMPAEFPANGLLAARVGLLAADEGWVEPYSRAVFLAEFGDGADISDPQVLAGILGRIGRDNPENDLERAGEAANKERLRRQTGEAEARGVFGAPTFITQTGELFWGDDRLEQALAWAGGAHEGD